LEGERGLEAVRAIVESRLMWRAGLHEKLADAYHDLAFGDVESAKRKLREILAGLDTA
jgi:predicted heme/steroid binding protein